MSNSRLRMLSGMGNGDPDSKESRFSMLYKEKEQQSAYLEEGLGKQRNNEEIELRSTQPSIQIFEKLEITEGKEGLIQTTQDCITRFNSYATMADLVGAKISEIIKAYESAYRNAAANSSFSKGSLLGGVIQKQVRNSMGLTDGAKMIVPLREELYAMINECSEDNPIKQIEKEKGYKVLSVIDKDSLGVSWENAYDIDTMVSSKDVNNNLKLLKQLQEKCHDAKMKCFLMINEELVRANEINNGM